MHQQLSGCLMRFWSHREPPRRLSRLMVRGNPQEEYLGSGRGKYPGSRFTSRRDAEVVDALAVFTGSGCTGSTHMIV